jgi:hypothetical protein
LFGGPPQLRPTSTRKTTITIPRTTFCKRGINFSS